MFSNFSERQDVNHKYMFSKETVNGLRKGQIQK